MWRKLDPRITALNVETKINSTKGGHGFSPFEIWNNRTQFSNIPLKINIDEIKEYIKQCRRLNRHAKDRNEIKGRIRAPYVLKPFERGDVYGNSLVSPIKLGDYCLIEGNYDKNRQHPWFKVVSSKEFPTGIDWEHGMVQTEKMGLTRRSLYTWSFKSLKAIIDGRENKEKDMQEKAKAIAAFVNQVSELTMIEHMKPRSTVYEKALWPYGRSMPVVYES